MLIDRGSLSQTVDAINAAQCDGRTLTAAERGEVARWIAARQGLPGAYADTFAGFPAERVQGHRPERDGQRRSGDGVEVCGARARTRGEPRGAISHLRATPA